MLGAIESLLSAVVADSMANTRHDSNAGLIGQGAANILSPFSVVLLRSVQLHGQQPVFAVVVTARWLALFTPLRLC